VLAEVVVIGPRAKVATVEPVKVVAGLPVGDVTTTPFHKV
jgi:hypothetical protein